MGGEQSRQGRAKPETKLGVWKHVQKDEEQSNIEALDLELHSQNNELERIKKFYQQANSNQEHQAYDLIVDFQNQYHDSDSEEGNQMKQSKLLESLNLDSLVWKGPTQGKPKQTKQTSQ